MKIALVSPYDYSYPGGVTEHVRHLEQEFQRRGHEVKIIAPSSSNDIVEDNVYKVGGIVPIPASGSIVRITLSPGAYRKVKAILLREQFQIIHLHEPLMPVLPPVVLRHSKTVNIGTFHAYRESHLGYYYGKPLLKRFMSRLHGRICVSPAAYELVHRYFPGAYRIIPNGISPHEFAPERAQPLPQYADGKLNILFLGRMEERKGFRYLFSAFPAVKQQFPQARLLVAGGYKPEEVEPFRQEAQDRHIDDIVFAGRVSEQDKARYYGSCDIFCAPSTGFESQGIVLLEAMAAGKAVVASDIPGYRSVVTNNQEGLLVPPRNESSLAAALVRLLAAPDMRAALGEQGRKTAQRYAWDIVAGEILDYYGEVRQRVLRRRHLQELLSAR